MKKIILFIIILTSQFSSAHEETINHVLILNSYHKGFKWTDDQVKSATKVITKEIDELELHIEYLDTKRIYNDIYLSKLKQIFKLKYKNIKFNLIITTDDNALSFVMNNHYSLFKNAPVSFCGINDYDKDKFGKYFKTTGLIEILDIKGTIDLAIKLFPKTSKVFVIVDSTPTGVGQLKEIKKVAANHFKFLKFIYFTGSNYTHEELLKNLKKIPDDSIALLTVWLRDKNEDYQPCQIAGREISKITPVPLFGIIDMYFGYGILGGQLLNSSTHGRMAAEIGIELFKGKRASELPIITTSTNPYMFDYEQLKRWGISQKILPENSIIINKMPTLYEKYTTEVVIIFVMIIIMIFVILYLSFTIIKRKKAEKALNCANGELKNKSQFIGSMIDLIPDILYIYDLVENKNKFVNQAFSKILGFSDEELKEMGSGLLEKLLHPDDFEKYLREIVPAYGNLEDNEVLEHSYRILHKNGSWRWVTSKEIIFERMTDGSPGQILGLIQDITFKKESAEKIEESLKEKEVLLKEIHHRVKNNLQIIISLIDLHRCQIEEKDPMEIFDATVRRIYSISLVHELLYKSSNFSSINFQPYVEKMVDELQNTYDSKESIEINIDVDNIYIGIGRAIPCGMILTELITNSLKYAFPNNRNGKIDIQLKNVDENTIQFIFHDDGVGLPEEIDIEKGDYLGLKLIKILTKQIHGEFFLDRKKGTTFYIKFSNKESV